MESFKQRHFFEVRRYTLKKDGVQYVTRNLDGSADLFVPYDQLVKVQRQYSEKKSIFAALSIITFLLAGLMAVGERLSWVVPVGLTPFLLILGGLFGLSYWVTSRHYKAIELTNGQCLFVLKASPSLADVNEFIESIFKARDDYLKTKFFHIDFNNHPSAEIRKFDWLRNEGVINDEEFDFMKNKINVLTSNHEED